MSDHVGDVGSVSNGGNTGYNSSMLGSFKQGNKSNQGQYNMYNIKNGNFEAATVKNTG
jgi:hypothetical protein